MLDVESSGEPEHDRCEQRPQVHLLKRQTDRNGARHGAERRVALIRQPVRGCQYGHQCPERENAEQLSAAERLGAPGRDRIAIGGVYHTFIIRRVEAERSIEKCNWSRGRAVGNKHARKAATASVIQ